MTLMNRAVSALVCKTCERDLDSNETERVDNRLQAIADNLMPLMMDESIRNRISVPVKTVDAGTPFEGRGTSGGTI